MPLAAPPLAFALFATLAMSALSITPAQSQRFPDKPIRLVVPFPPGGGTDIGARVIAPKMSEALGQALTVENRAGAAGNIGAEAVAQAPADGYTLLMGSNTLPINAALQPGRALDATKRLAPVGMAFSAPMVLSVHPSVAATDLPTFLQLARREPGKLNFANPGNGTPHHLAAALLATMGKIDMAHVMYKGNGQAVADLLAGHAQVSVLTLGTAKPHFDSGKLRPLAITGDTRAAAVPQLPTIAEAGLPGYAADLWFAMFAPAGTPAPVIARLNEALAAALSNAEVRERLAPQGFEIRAGTPAALMQTLANDTAKYTKLVRDANIRAE